MPGGALIMGSSSLGRLLIFLGLIVVTIGVILASGGKVPLLGRLPGDFVIHRGRTTWILPLGTSVVLSVLLSLLARLFK